jgi:hypothetical protein
MPLAATGRVDVRVLEWCALGNHERCVQNRVLIGGVLDRSDATGLVERLTGRIRGRRAPVQMNNSSLLHEDDHEAGMRVPRRRRVRRVLDLLEHDLVVVVGVGGL